ncbi:uncharacterized protein LOC142579866 [Dermacentor variabilis]|uniref:uncharacterized protein LOC142579866 n=1 Tax=Dermacentor variabilis TaxID=34621 RepID=UPI003F5BA620
MYRTTPAVLPLLVLLLPPLHQGLPVNVTWMCVNSLETGCFVEYMASHFVKEVCLCADRHHCNAAGVAAPIPLVALLLCAVWIAVLRKASS